jgi:hypothetical protein
VFVCVCVCACVCLCVCVCGVYCYMCASERECERGREDDVFHSPNTSFLSEFVMWHDYIMNIIT